MKKLFLGIFLSLLLCFSAQAYQVGFDVTGSGTFDTGTDEASSEYYDQFNLDGTGQYEWTPTGNFYDIISSQSIVGSDLIFTESFVLEISEGDNLGFSGETEFSNFYAKIDLTGTVGLTSTEFTTGTITMFMNTTDVDPNLVVYDPTAAGDADIIVATLELQGFNEMLIGSSTLTQFVEGDINLNFVFTETEFDYDGDSDVDDDDKAIHDFWNEEVDDLTNFNWLLAFVGEGDVTAEEVGLDENNEGDVAWGIAAITAEFTAVPEPTTMLLLGFGLVGIAGISRKKQS